MSNYEHPEFKQFFDSLETLADCVNHMDTLTDNGSLALLNDFLTLAEKVDTFIKQQKDLPLHRCHEMFENMRYYADINISPEYEADGMAIYREYTKPMVELWLKCVTTAVEGKADKKLRSSLYPPLTKLERSEIDGVEYPCKVSVIVIGYNHLDYTKQCVESILEHTNDVGGYELVLVNNGSADGTQEYFESIENAKVVYLPANCGATVGMSAGMALSHGKYAAVCANDMVLTPRWLSNLLSCIESNPAYGYVSPVSNFISNLQKIDANFTGMDEMQVFAEGYNKPDAKKWEERQVLLPNILCAPRKLAAHVGYYDPRYYYGEFADDDFSFMIRRAGYKLILCRDTFVYHYGHITTDTEHKENKSIQVSRKVFAGKWGFDASADARPNASLCNLVDMSGWEGSKRLLAVNAKCGCTPQTVVNKYRSASNGEIDLHIWSGEQKYETDLKDLHASVTGSWEKPFIGAYEKASMDCVVIDELPFMNSGGLLMFFQEAHSVLKTNGQLVLTINNPISYSALTQMVYSSDVPARAVINPSHVNSLLQKAGFQSATVVSEVNGKTVSQDIEPWKTLFPIINEQILKNVFTVNQYLFNAIA